MDLRRKPSELIQVRLSIMELLSRTGYTQDEIGKIMHTSKQAVSRNLRERGYEGSVRRPTLPTVEQVARVEELLSTNATLQQIADDLHRSRSWVQRRIVRYLRSGTIVPCLSV